MNRLRKFYYRVLMFYHIRSLRDETVAFYNLRKPLVDHLNRIEEIETRKILGELSPIPRHDLSEFDKLVMADDLIKRHPNPKMQDSPYEKYRESLTRIPNSSVSRYKAIFANFTFRLGQD